MSPGVFIACSGPGAADVIATSRLIWIAVAVVLLALLAVAAWRRRAGGRIPFLSPLFLVGLLVGHVVAYTVFGLTLGDCGYLLRWVSYGLGGVGLIVLAVGLLASRTREG